MIIRSNIISLLYRKEDKMEKSKVYFIREITPGNIIKAYEALGKNLEGNVAVKMHSGEQGNQNY